MKQLVVIILIFALTTALVAQTDNISTEFSDKNESYKLTESVKLKELANIHSANVNILTGIGIVSGLAGKGDSAKTKNLKEKILVQTLKIETEDLNGLESKNTALVSVNLKITGNVIKGSKQHVYVASILDAKDLTNGILLKTELKNQEGKTIAIAAGNVKTTNKAKGLGYILDGAIINENQNDFHNYNITLKKGDYILAKKISNILNHKKINNKIKSDSVIEIEVKEISVLGSIENIEIQTIPKVLIDKKNGIIAASENAEIGSFIFSIEQKNKDTINNENKKTTIEIKLMKLNEFILKNNDNLSIGEIIKIIQAAKKINKLNGELIMEEINGKQN